ncbi:MAG: N(4)-(beta-N-acetylglucosaminyl)-L-asparaginase [Candidatus Omnitrophota bacterium]
MAKRSPIILSTWRFGLRANEAGWEILTSDGNALDAVEAAAVLIESDPNETSVGYGGYPNEMGVVQLDAAIIDGKTGRMGAVGALEGIRNPIGVARKILEEKKHIFLVGEGAKSFALKHGFKEETLLTEKSAAWYAEQLKKKEADKGHDTIGVLSLDAQEDMAAACTTSGLAMKWSGRVGDSPLIGCGLYLDGQVGGAVGTGVGERAIEVCGSFAIVEFMRNGLCPQKACEKLILRVVERNRPNIDFQLAFMALNCNGETGGAALQEGFVYAEYAEQENTLKTGAVYRKDFR